MRRDHERVRRIQAGLKETSLDAVICAFPNHVLLASGYWPVIGVSLAIVTREGQVVALVPEDEKELAHNGWADEVQCFRAASLKNLSSTRETITKVLSETTARLGLGRHSAIGYEDDEVFIPAPYAACHVFGAALPRMLQEAVPGAKLVGAGELLSRLKSVLTPAELERVRLACQLASHAFRDGAKGLRSGMREPEVANEFQSALTGQAKDLNQPERAGGWVWCMSGPNSAEAAGAYARTRDRQIEPGDFVLVHGNSYADGFWTDLTRTFCLGQPDERKRVIYRAVFTAFGAALDAIKPGARAADVDRAARSVMEKEGLGSEFKHATGHGVGFSAINHDAKPRLHPVSPEVLETGMVFNVEPAAYISGYGGLRHCSVVAVTDRGAEVLTASQASVEELVVTP